MASWHGESSTSRLPRSLQALTGDKGFLSKARLSKYDEKRNDPTVADALSGLSPYLHFGHLAPQRAAIEAAKHKSVHKVRPTGWEGEGAHLGAVLCLVGAAHCLRTSWSVRLVLLLASALLTLGLVCERPSAEPSAGCHQVFSRFRTIMHCISCVCPAPQASVEGFLEELVVRRELSGEHGLGKRLVEGLERSLVAPQQFASIASGAALSAILSCPCPASLPFHRPYCRQLLPLCGKLRLPGCGL